MAAALILFLLTTAASSVFTQVTNSNPDTNVILETGICRKCLCKDTKVDCQKQGLTSFFAKEEWAALKDLQPTIVDMSDNSFENITVLADLPIETLNLSLCGIEYIENGSFKPLKKTLRVLDLSHNKLTSKLSPDVFEGTYSPEEYEPLQSLRTLNLAYNDFHSVDQDLFEHLSELTELDLSGNPLLTLDLSTLIAITSLQNLKVLRMRSCQLTEIPDKFLHTPRDLMHLDISDNLLAAIPQELAEARNLVYLNLNQNPIKKLEMHSEDYPGFPRLRKLEELHMCNMQSLQEIGIGALGGLESLKALHMSFNPMLSTIHPKALARPDDIGETYDWPPVKKLYLKSNNLQAIDSRLLSRWDFLEAIDVSDNPFLCDCSTQWMVDILVSVVDGKKENASAAMVCQDPVEMRGYTMKHLHDIHRTMRCVDKYGHRPEQDGSILLEILCGVLLAVPITLALVVLWNRGYFRCLGLRGPSNIPRAFYKRAPNEDSIM